MALEIAAYQWETVIEQAARVYHLKEGRAVELTRLRASASILDRYAADLIRQWDEARRQERRAR